MKKKECRIVTFHNAVNYGAVLQAFALKKVLSTFCKTTVYDHCNDYFKKQYSINPFKVCRFKYVLKGLINYIPRYKKTRSFNRFIKKYLTNEKGCSDNAFYITGSDQVWNCKCSGFDKTYFLDFINDGKLKNSYSASFGFDRVPEEYQEEYKRLLSDYNLISVRENEGTGIIKDLLGRDVPVTLDPTLLLTKQEWQASFSQKEISFKKYILVYAFTVSETMKNFIIKLSKFKNLPVIVLMPEKTMHKKLNIQNAIYKSYESPEKWINYFLSATYIVTNSFHGTAFSINFNKPFFVEYLDSSINVNSRFETLLNETGLKSRIINNNTDIDEVIDYSVVNSIIDEKRKDSIDYLKSIVSSYNE